ncbi:MAG: glycosyltransferase [Chloracidobacterium sp.]|nr:glycosyltransferase [Chloracidobacterium sp.]MDW8217989.1 glycosyltransferase family 2 protein [Acidobacteriota bacterium]
MTKPLVSVVLCVHNREDFLAEAMASILGQTLDDLELIIVDDASTDASPEVARSFNDRRVRYFRNETNLGHAVSLDRGIAEARGQYIALMDSDDISLPERLEQQVAFLEANPAVALCGGWVETFGAYAETRRFPYEPEDLKVHLLAACPLSTPTILLRRTTTASRRFSAQRFEVAHDYAYWVDVAFEEPIANLPEVVLRYRVHAGQITLTRRAKQLAETRMVLRRQLESLLGYGNDADVAALEYVFVNEAQPDPPLPRIGDLFERMRAANRRRRRYDPARLDRMLDEKWTHLVAGHAPSASEMWRQALRRPGLWSLRLGEACVRRALRPLKHGWRKAQTA